MEQILNSRRRERRQELQAREVSRLAMLAFGGGASNARGGRCGDRRGGRLTTSKMWSCSTTAERDLFI